MQGYCISEQRYVIAEPVGLGKCLFSSIPRGYWQD